MLRADRVTAQGFSGIIEVDDTEFRFQIVLIEFRQVLVVDYFRQVRKLIVIDEHRVLLGYHLLDERSIDRE